MSIVSSQRILSIPEPETLAMWQGFMDESSPSLVSEYEWKAITSSLLSIVRYASLLMKVPGRMSKPPSTLSIFAQACRKPGV